MDIQILSEYVYEDLNGLITSVSGNEEQVVTFECDDAEVGDRRRTFKLQCHNVVESNVCPAPTGNIRFLADHPLLYHYTGQSGYLYYSTAPKNRLELFARVWEAHERLFRGWRSVQDYANVSLQKGGLSFCPDANGLLAQGPKLVLDAFEAAVKDHIQVKFVPSVMLSGNFRALIFDETYLICESVSVAEVTEG